MKCPWMRKEFQWPLIYFGTFMTFVVYPLATTEYQEQLRFYGHPMEMAQSISQMTSIVYGWAVASLLKTKKLATPRLSAIFCASLLIFLFGQTVTVAPPHQWSSGMFSIASGIVCASTAVSLLQRFRKQTKERNPESPDSH